MATATDAAAAATDAVDAAAATDAAAAATDAVDAAAATAAAISVPALAKKLGANVITINEPEWPAPPGTIQHLHKTLLQKGDTFGARFKTVKVDENSKFWSIYGEGLESPNLSILNVEDNVFTFQSGASSTRHTLEPREECIVAYTDMMSDMKYILNKATGEYENEH